MQDKVTRTLKAIADPTRREIFHALIVTAAAMSITHISSRFDITRQGITKHLKTLEQAGLVKIHVKGRESYCIADATPLKELNKWLNFYEKFWDNKLGNLESYLNSNT